MTDAEIHRIYNSFPPEGRNMSRADFCKQCKELTDPVKMQQDANRITQGRRERMILDRALEN